MPLINNPNLKTVNQIHDFVIDKIGEDGVTIHISRSYSTLKTDVERIKFIRQLMKAYNIVIPFIASKKDDNKSEVLRNKGNESYKNKQYETALLLYNESLALAPDGSKSLALAYGNRSALLFQIKKYAAAMLDIQQAKASNYPEDLLVKLDNRRLKCILHLNNVTNEEHQRFETNPLLNGSNHEIPCASAALSLEFDVNFGRRMVAKHDIAPGSILVEESPFTCTLAFELRYSRCSNCLRKSYNLIPCLNCTEAMFCSTECMDAAFSHYHRLECAILASIKSLDLSKIQFLSFRVAIRALTFFNSDINALKKSVDAIEKHMESNSKLAGFSKDSNGELKYISNTYDAVHCLVAHSEIRKVSDLFYRGVVAFTLVMILQNNMDIINNFNDDDTDFFGSLILHHLQTSSCNMHTLSELADNSCQDQQLGNGAFPVHSLFNHSCSPNVSRYSFYECGKIIMKTIALLPIAAGEEIFDNYGYIFYYNMFPVDCVFNLCIIIYFSGITMLFCLRKND